MNAVSAAGKNTERARKKTRRAIEVSSGDRIYAEVLTDRA
jgi:hypothetical protein